MGTKEFKTIAEQIELLKSRGLQITDEPLAEEFLRNTNYYRVSGYSLTLRNHDVFYESASFQNIVDIYRFDHELRHVLLKYIEQIEVRIKSIYAYEFARMYGSLEYMNSSHFTDPLEYVGIMAKANDQKTRSLQHEAFVQHYVIDLQEDMPIWAYIELFTLGDISKLYHISLPELKTVIANQFGLHMNMGPVILGEYLYSMTTIRNFCAHGNRLFNRLFIRKPSLNSKEKGLLIKSDDGTIDNSHLYGFVIMMRRLIDHTSFEETKAEVIALHKKYPFVSMRYYGFRDDWEQLL